MDDKNSNRTQSPFEFRLNEDINGVELGYNAELGLYAKLSLYIPELGEFRKPALAIQKIKI